VFWHFLQRTEIHLKRFIHGKSRFYLSIHIIITGDQICMNKSFQVHHFKIFFTTYTFKSRYNFHFF